MTLTINLTEEEETRVRCMAERAGVAPEALVRLLIGEGPSEIANRPKTPAEAIAYWRKMDVLGSYGDPSMTSQEVAREIRRQAETRESQ